MLKGRRRISEIMYRVLRQVKRVAPHGIRPCEIAERMELRPHYVRDVLERAYQKQWVTRDPGKHSIKDGTLYFLSPEGEAVLRQDGEENYV